MGRCHAVVERHNQLLLEENGRNPLERFSGINNDLVPTEFHTGGYLKYTLDATNQTEGIGTHTWEPRSHSKFYLGR